MSEAAEIARDRKMRREALVATILPAMKASLCFGSGPTTAPTYMREAFKEADRIIAESDRREAAGE